MRRIHALGSEQGINLFKKVGLGHFFFGQTEIGIGDDSDPAAGQQFFQLLFQGLLIAQQLPDNVDAGVYLFLRQAAIELDLPNVSVHGGRVEQYHPADGFAAIVSRAFAELADFAALSRHLLTTDGVWLAMKGVRPDGEIVRLPGGVRVEAVHPLCVPGVDGERHLVVMRRVAAE